MDEFQPAPRRGGARSPNSPTQSFDETLEMRAKRGIDVVLRGEFEPVRDTRRERTRHE